MNSDQVLGLLLYVLERHDGDRFRKWLEWIRSKGSPKRFCSLEGGDVGQCVFRPTDCALILLVGATVGQQTAALSLCPPADVLGLFSPVGYMPRIEDAFKLYDGALALYNKNLGLVQDLQKQLNLDVIPSVPLPPIPDLAHTRDQAKQVSDNFQKLQDLLLPPTLSSRAAAYFFASSMEVANAAVAGATRPGGQAASARPSCRNRYLPAEEVSGSRRGVELGGCEAMVAGTGQCILRLPSRWEISNG